MSLLKVLLGGLFTLFVVGLLAFYWFIPGEKLEFSLTNSGPEHSNFLLNSSVLSDMQFYPNMRYQDSGISYRIDMESCTLQKRDDMERALEKLEEITVLDFYPVEANAELGVTCSDDVIINEDFFVAGEGGPVNITKTDNFNVIFHGKVLLLRDSKCPMPNVAIHETLHALGFKHSENPNNIMYPVTKCDQIIGNDIPEEINRIYSIKPAPDLIFNDVSATIEGRHLDANVSIRNYGLTDSKNAKLYIYADGKQIKEENIEPLKVGYGITMVFTNILVTQIDVEEIEFEIISNFEELEKNNNKVKLETKN